MLKVGERSPEKIARSNIPRNAIATLISTINYIHKGTTKISQTGTDLASIIE